jgi:hypothetical protein
MVAECWALVAHFEDVLVDPSRLHLLQGPLNAKWGSTRRSTLVAESVIPDLIHRVRFTWRLSLSSRSIVSSSRSSS